MAKLLSPLSSEIFALRRVLDTRLESRIPLTIEDIRRMVEKLTAMEAAAAGLEEHQVVDVSEKALELARRLLAAGIVQ